MGAFPKVNMESENKAWKKLDCRGRPCPLPVMDLALFARKLTPGSLILLLATDPAAELDVKAWCLATGHQFLERWTIDEVVHLLIRKESSSAVPQGG